MGIDWGQAIEVGLPLLLAGAGAVAGGQGSDASGSQTTTVTPGQMPDRGDEVWAAVMDRVFGTDDQPGLEQLGQEQADKLRQQFGTYMDQMGQAIQPYKDSLVQASQGAIPVSMGNTKLGGLVPQGGINLGKQMMGAQSILPETQWQFNQAMPENKAAIDYANMLKDFGMKMQGLAYQTPVESTTGSANIGGGLTSALQNAMLGLNVGNALSPQLQSLSSIFNNLPGAIQNWPSGQVGR